MKKNILITGVAGLLGSRLADWIIENKPDEYNVIGIDDLSGGYKENIHPEVTFFKKDLSRSTRILSGDTQMTLERIFTTYKIDYVYHLAAYAAEGLSPFIRTFNYDNNLKSTAFIVNECIKNNVKRLVFTSTMAVYGHGEGGIFHEDMRRNPIDPYGIAKAACERDIEVANEQHGLDYCIIRPHNVYGIKQNIWDKYRNVLGIWMYYIMEKKPITIFGDGSQRRAFSYVDDSLEPLFKAHFDPRCSKQIINLGGIEAISIAECAEELKLIVGGSEVVHLEKRHEVHSAFATWQKSIDLLDFEFKTPLKEGLARMWEWAQKQPKRERFVWSKYEIDKGIYDYWKK